MSDRETRIISMCVTPKGEPIYSERGFIVSIEDEGGGEFLVVRDGQDGKISFDPEDWNSLMIAIGKLVGECRD